jgi:O-antigen/teichoic acid export membrane protein
MQQTETYSNTRLIPKFALLVLARVVSPLALFAIVVLIARLRGQGVLGEFSTVWVWLTIFQLASFLGLGEYVSKEVGARRGDASRYLTHGLLLGFFYSIVCAVLMAAAGAVLKYPDAVKHGITIGSVSIPFFVCTLTCQSVFTALQEIRFVAITALLEHTALLIACATVIGNGYGIVPLMWSVVVVRAMAAALNLVVSHRWVVPIRLEVDWNFWVGLLAPVAVFGVTGLCSQLFRRVSVVLLSKMDSMETVGIFSSAARLGEICLIVPSTFYLLILPIAASGYRKHKETTTGQIEGYARDLFVVVFLMVGGGWVLAEALLALVYGQPFAEAGWILRILMLVLLVHSAEIVYGMCCQAAGYHKITMYFSLLRAGIGIVLGVILIRQWGGVGAAVSILCSSAISLVMLQGVMKSKLGGLRWTQIIKKPALACSILVVALYPLKEHVNVLVLATIFISGFVLLLFLMNGFAPLQEKPLSTGRELK